MPCRGGVITGVMGSCYLQAWMAADKQSGAGWGALGAVTPKNRGLGQLERWCRRCAAAHARCGAGSDALAAWSRTSRRARRGAGATVTSVTRRFRRRCGSTGRAGQRRGGLGVGSGDLRRRPRPASSDHAREGRHFERRIANGAKADGCGPSSACSPADCCGIPARPTRRGSHAG